MMPHIAVISANRPARVPEMRGHLRELADQVTWYVRDESEAEDYRYVGAGSVVAAGDLVSARNLALEHAFAEDRLCVQLSDDLTGIDFGPDRDRKSRITLPLALGMMVRHAVGDVHLVGAGATDNLFFMAKGDISEHAFILGDLCVVAPTDLRFDPALRLKEDLELSIQMMKRYGKVARLNTILPNFQHRVNAGGVVDYRTEQLEQASIAFIMIKHPGWVKMNPRRENEILLEAKPPTGVPA